MTLPVAPELFDVLLQCAKDAKKGKVKSGGETSAALTFCEDFYAQFFQNRMRHQIERFDRAAKESAIRLRMEVKEKKGPIALIDGYHSWLYANIRKHAQNIERVLGLYYASLARGDDDPEAYRDFEVAIQAHQFGRFAEIQKRFSLGALWEARPRIILLGLYGTLVACALVTGALVFVSKKNPVAKFECTAVSGAANVFVCKPK